MSGEEPTTQIAPAESPKMMSTVKLPILKKGEYTLWSMRMEQYLTNTDYSLSKAKSILLLAIPDEYQLRFHGIKDAKSPWAAIKSRFGGNVESKKMQKTILKQQFEKFSVSDTKGLDKAYDRFQKLISLLEVHGAAVLNEDANQKFLRALPSLWNNVALIMRNKDEDTSNSNEVNTANGVSTASGHNSQGQASSSSYTDDLMFSFFANQSNSPQLDDEDLEQIVMMFGKKMNLNGRWPWLFMRVISDFIRRLKTVNLPMGKEPAEPGTILQDFSQWRLDALVFRKSLIVQDGLGYDWSYIAQDEPTEFALMAYTSNSLGSNTELGLESVEAHVFDSRSSDRDDNQTNDRFKKDNGYHAIPPPLTGNYMPPLAGLSFVGLDDYVYRPTANKTSASVSQVETNTSQTSNTSVEIPRVESVRPNKPSFKRIEFTNARNESVKPKQADKSRIITQNPKRMAKKSNLKNMGKNYGQREIRPVWNSAQRINHHNKFVPSVVLTRFGRVPVSAAKQSSLRATTSTSTFRPINTATHTNKVNVSKLKTNAFHKSHSPIRRSFYKIIAPNTRILNEKVNTVRVNGVNTAGQTIVSTVKGTGVTAVKASAGNPQQALKNKGIFDSGCSRHMTGNKDFLTDYQDIDGGFVAFGGSARGGPRASNKDFKRHFMSLYGQDVDTFTRTMLLNVDQLQKQLDKDEFQEDGSMTAFWMNRGSTTFFSEIPTTFHTWVMLRKPVAERTRHQRQYDRRVNKRQMQTQESKIDTGKAVDADLVKQNALGGPDSNKPMGNGTIEGILLNAYLCYRTQHTEQPEIINEGRVDQFRKVFAIAALKNELRKLKRNSVDTKFDKTLVLGKPVLPSLRNQSVVRQPNAFKSKRAQMSKQRFASQVDVNKNLSKPVTQHYLPMKTESAFANPDHMIASSSSRNSSKNMPRFSSNDMVHNHYLDLARKKIHERDRTSTTSVTTFARIQTTVDDSKPKPRSNNQTSRSLPCIFNANHDACIIKLPKEVNSRAKIQFHKTRNSNKPIDQKSYTQKPSRQIFTGHRFSPNKTFAVYEKTSPRSDLRWKPTGRIFKSVSLRWIPTGKLFDSCISKVDSEPPHGSNVDIPNIHECKQTLDVSAGTSINVQKEQNLDLSAAVTTADASDKHQQQPDSTSSGSTLATTVSADGHFDVYIFLFFSLF
ncbi:hypothetical protein Tco_0404124 [Tanacetum coccineum]